MQNHTNDTTNRPNPCNRHTNEQRRDNTRPRSMPDLHAEAIKDAIREALGA